MAEIELEFDGAVAVITLNAPARRNALSVEMAEQLREACNQIDANLAIGATVIRGAGGTFCAGAELKALSAISGDPASTKSYSQLSAIYGAFLRLGEIAVPTVAAIRGAAVGAGLNLALVADLRIASPDAQLVTGFLRIGVHPGGGSFTLLERLVGREAAAALAIFGETLTGDRAREVGAVWETVPDDHVESRAFDLARQAAADPELVRRAIASWRAETAIRLPVSLAAELERAPQMWSLRRRGTG